MIDQLHLDSKGKLMEKIEARGSAISPPRLGGRQPEYGEVLVLTNDHRHTHRAASVESANSPLEHDVAWEYLFRGDNVPTAFQEAAAKEHVRLVLFPFF